jgi:hypothetical protein
MAEASSRGERNCLQTPVIAATMLDNAQPQVEVYAKLALMGLIACAQDV